MYKPYENELNFNGIACPISVKDVPKFEINNDISVNIYILQKRSEVKYDVVPLHITTFKRNQHVNLLLIQNFYDIEDDNNNNNNDAPVYHEEGIRFHYVYIKNLSRLVGNQLTKHKCQIHICDRCLHYFPTAEKLATHDVDVVK